MPATDDVQGVDPVTRYWTVKLVALPVPVCGDHVSCMPLLDDGVATRLVTWAGTGTWGKAAVVTVKIEDDDPGPAELIA